MNQIVEQLNSAGTAFVQFAVPMLIQSSLLIVILLSAAWMLRKRTRAVVRYWLLLLILAKLVLPTSLASPTGVGYWLGEGLLTPSMEGAVVAWSPERTSEEKLQIVADEAHVSAVPVDMVADEAMVGTGLPRTATGVDTVREAVSAAQPTASISLTWQALVFLAWAGIALAMLVLLIQRSVFVTGLIAQSRAAGSEIQQLLDACLAQLGLRRRIKLKLSANTTTPAVCGLLRPVILLPEHLSQKLDTRQLRTVLLHELAHVQRGDLWVNLIQALLLIVYFYNPLVWLANAAIRRVREQAVDETVLVALAEKAESYPTTLLDVARLSLARPALSLRLIGVVESKKALSQRIKHIVNRPLPKTAKLGLVGLLVVLIGAAFLLPMAGAQGQETDHTPAEVKRRSGSDDDAGAPGPVLAQRAEAQRASMATDESQIEPLSILCVDRENNVVPGAEVYLVEKVGRVGVEPRPLSVLGPVRTNEMGVAVFAGVPVRHANGFGWTRTAYARLPGRMAGIGDQRYWPNVSTSLPDDPLKIMLAKTAEVTGVITVPEGFASDDVTVRVMTLMIRSAKVPMQPVMFQRRGPGRRDLWPQLFEVTPDAQGRFAFQDLPSNAMVYLAAEGPGLGQAQFMSDEPRSLSEIAFKMSSQGVIEGTLSYKDTDKRAEGVTLMASPQNMVFVRETFESVVDANGRFRFAGLTVGAYNIALPRTFDRSEWTMPVRGLVQVSAGQTVRGIDLQLERGAMVSGIVTDAETGLPLDGVHVSALSGIEQRQSSVGSTRTDDEGRYTLRLPSGQTRLHLSAVPKGYAYPRHPGHVALRIAEGETHKEGVNFAVSRAQPAPPSPTYGTARGRVLGPDGTPFEGIRVETQTEWQESDIRFYPSSRGHTDGAGRYELTVVAGREFWIRTGGGQYSTPKSKTFNIGEGGFHEVEDLVLRRGTSFIEGQVLDGEGGPIEGAIVEASSPSKGGRIADEPNTDSEGRFRIEHLMVDEPLTVVVRKLGYEYRNWNSIPPGTKNLRFTLYAMADKAFHIGQKQLPKPQAIIGKPAPEWQVDQWVQEPAPPGRPKRDDGKATILVFGWSNDWSEVGPELKQLEQTCDRAGAVAVIILSHPAHESWVRPAIQKYDLKLGVGIDRFVPQSEYMLSNATMIAYGFSKKMPIVFIIDAEGIVRYFQSGFEGVGEALEKYLN